MAERTLYRPRRWTPTRRFARAWWYCWGTPSYFDRHPDLDWAHPLHRAREAVDEHVRYFERVPRKLARLIRLLVQEARDDDEIGYVGVAVVEDACMAVGQKGIEAVYRSRLDHRRREIVLNAMYASYRTGDFGLAGFDFPYWSGPWWWKPLKRARGRARARRYYGREGGTPAAPDDPRDSLN